MQPTGRDNVTESEYVEIGAYASEHDYVWWASPVGHRGESDSYGALLRAGVAHTVRDVRQSTGELDNWVYWCAPKHLVGLVGWLYRTNRATLGELEEALRDREQGSKERWQRWEVEFALQGER